MRRTRKPQSTATALLLSTNRGTLNDLGNYFAEAGVVAHATTALNPLCELRDDVQVIVLFPDDFRDEEVESYLSIVHARRPGLAIVVVTRSPNKYRSIADTEDRPIETLVLPKPAFGWQILELTRDVISSGMLGAL